MPRFIYKDPIKPLVERWRQIPGVRPSEEDGPTFAKALQTFGESEVQTVLEIFEREQLLTEVRYPIRFLWGFLRHHRATLRRVERGNEWARRRLEDTEKLLEERRQWRVAAGLPPDFPI